MQVKFLDLECVNASIAGELESAFSRVLRSGWYILGRELEKFEGEFAEFTGADECVGVGNGLDAIFLALRAVGVQPGDEVVVPANTYIATWLAVSRCGARPVPVDPPRGAVNLDAASVGAALTPRTRAIVPVHLYGLPVDAAGIAELGKKHGVAVVEDAAQAHGAKWKGRAIGAHGDAVAWSFYPGKNLGALGDGGAVTTNNANVAERVRVLRNYGSREKYLNDTRGVNSRLDGVQSALLSVKLHYLTKWNDQRREVAKHYTEGLRHTGLGLPAVEYDADPVWHLYVVRSPKRDKIREYLSNAGIQTLIHYPIPPHLQEAYRDAGYRKGDFPVTEHLAEEVLSLPMGPHLSWEQVEYVIETLTKFNG